LAAVQLVKIGHTPAQAAAMVEAPVRSVRSACSQLGVPYGVTEHREKIAAGLRAHHATAERPDDAAS
jgi:hypothetical protein